jgi:ABC-type multidrug transport system fused ATPase/permease subunit
VVALLAVVVVVENAARLSVPLLVQRGIDHGIPPIVATGDSRELILILAGLCGVVALQAGSRMFFLRRSGRIGQKVLIELRRRLFRHFQRLDVAFHDRYTSGRVGARSTNDVDAIQDMLATGFDGLITAVLTMFGTAVLLVTLDWRLGLLCLLALPGAGRFGVVVPQRIGQDLPQGPRGRGAGDRAVRRDDDRHQGRAGLPVAKRATKRSSKRSPTGTRNINEREFKLLAIFMPAVRLVGNIMTGVVLLYGGYLVLEDPR